MSPTPYGTQFGLCRRRWGVSTVPPGGSRAAQVAGVCFLPAEAQKKQLEGNTELAQEECVSETADHSAEEPAEGGPDADGEEVTDGVEEDFDEDGAHELVGANPPVPAPLGAARACQQLPRLSETRG